MIGDWETAITVGGVEIFDGLGVVVEEVALMSDTVVVVVTGNGARDKGGEEGNVFVGNVAVENIFDSETWRVIVILSWNKALHSNFTLLSPS